ncbi:MAG: diadenylate cyclase CdaA [Clostridia bacterium]
MSINSLLKALTTSFQNFQIIDAIDITIIAALIYLLIIRTKNTRAYQLIKGIAIAFLALAVSQLFGLTTLNWLLSSIFSAGIVVIAILFQPELRRGFEHIGRSSSFWGDKTNSVSITVVSELHKAILSLSRRKVGALIVIERKTGLAEIIDTGTKLDAIVSAPLIENIFEPNTPLHDGAVVIREDRIAAAACFLPMLDEVELDREMGTRHRAAMSISTVSDSLTIVVSEETGTISYTSEGRIVRYIDSKSLRNLLDSLFLTQNTNKISLLMRKRFGNKKSKR